MAKDFIDPLGLGVAVAVATGLFIVSAGISTYFGKRFRDEDRGMLMDAVFWIGTMSGNITASMIATALCGRTGSPHYRYPG